MKEREIFSYAKKVVEESGCLPWFTHKVKFYPATDIFGCFDMVFLNKAGIATFVQITTKNHLAHRRKKIINYFRSIGFPIPVFSYIWAWSEVAEDFIIEKL